MGNRLAGIAATLWFFFALLSLFVALALSPMGLRLLLPTAHPASWIYPTLLVAPPIALLSQRLLGARLSSRLLWPLTLALGIMLLALITLIGALFLGH
ncbi:hypothetical protein [Erythrobacter neustonensis]|uniref:Uncharacterized protein n=1 Tax=Erythrobacter neustonensis TaxID=1112 RepID=A0A192D341_9SPHN|nr:hypothetical protein [Erythrobacter neustonensis]ANK12903.1 hypothetical protein A9D12_08040 [Erythrobacter neustonensis]